jgi:hypothetical protein
MKRIAVFAMITIAGSLAAGNALAQQHEVRANVPFSFTAGGKMLPSGDYSITSVRDDVIEIQNQEQRAAVLTVAQGTVHQSKNGSVLVFERRGDQYSLREILCAPKAMNVRLPAEHLKKGSYMQEAMNSPSDGLVLIAVGN